MKKIILSILISFSLTSYSQDSTVYFKSFSCIGKCISECVPVDVTVEILSFEGGEYVFSLYNMGDSVTIDKELTLKKVYVDKKGLFMVNPYRNEFKVKSIYIDDNWTAIVFRKKWQHPFRKIISVYHN